MVENLGKSPEIFGILRKYLGNLRKKLKNDQDFTATFYRPSHISRKLTFSEIALQRNRANISFSSGCSRSFRPQTPRRPSAQLVLSSRCSHEKCGNSAHLGNVFSVNIDHTATFCEIFHRCLLNFCVESELYLLSIDEIRIGTSSEGS